MNLTAPAQIFFRDVFTFTSNSQIHALGTKAQTPDGRIYRWAKAGGTTLVSGNLLIGPVANGSQINLAVNTALAVLGATSFTVTPGAAVVANQYQGGYLSISNGAGFGIVYTLGSHAAGNSTVNVIFNLVTSESVLVAANSVTRVDLVYNPYAGVIQSPTVSTAPPVGFVVAPITNAQFGWVATHGPTGALYDGTVVAAAVNGAPVGRSASVAGAVSSLLTSNAASSSVVAGQVGYMMQTGLDTASKMVFATID